MRKSQAQLLMRKTKGKRTKRAVLKYFKGNRWPKNGLVYELHATLNSKYTGVSIQHTKHSVNAPILIKNIIITSKLKRAGYLRPYCSRLQPEIEVAKQH